MTNRHIETQVEAGTSGKQAEAVIWFDKALEEYHVQFFTLTASTRNHLRKANYFTDDKDDARGTARVQLKQLVA